MINYGIIGHVTWFLKVGLTVSAATRTWTGSSSSIVASFRGHVRGRNSGKKVFFQCKRDRGSGGHPIRVDIC